MGGFEGGTGPERLRITSDERRYAGRKSLGGNQAGHVVRPTGLSAALIVVSGSLRRKEASDERCDPYVGGQ